MLIDFEPGDYVKNPANKDWGIGQVQSIIGNKVTVNFENFGKKVINIETYISVGMVESNYFPFDNANVKYLWCKSTYPNDNQDIHLIPESFIKSKYYGFSDHFIGIEAALIAVTRGARLIEKHFTLDKANQTIRDHALSATPSEFKILVDHGRIIHNMLYSNVQ